MRTIQRSLAFLSVVLLLGNCGGGGSSPTVVPTPAPERAIIKVLIDPNPIISTPSGNPDYPWAFAVNIQLSDSGGVGFVVTSMQIIITADSTGLTAQSDENLFVGVKINANGQATRQFRRNAWRMDGNLTKEGTFNVKMNFVDDKGYASVYDSTVKMQTVGSPVR